MVRAAKKAPKGDDAFSDRKQKVGRKKLAPATATRAEVHARTLRINNAVPAGADNESGRGDAGDDSEIRRNFSENVVAAHHYRATVRMGALGALCAQLEADQFHISPVHRLQGLQASFLGLIDTDAQVRERAITLIDGLLRGSAPDLPMMSSLLQHVHIALTHAVFGVRKSGIEVIERLISRWPGALGAPNSQMLADGSSVDLMQIIRRAHDVVLASQRPNVTIVAKLLKELLLSSSGSTQGEAAAPSPKNLHLATDVADFFAAFGNTWLLQWKELMEMQYALFRDDAHAGRAVALGEMMVTIGMYLSSCGKLDKNGIRLLRDAFISRVPFSMQDLCSHDRSHTCSAQFSSPALAVVIAFGCAVIFSTTGNQDAQRCLQVFMSASLSSLPSTVSSTLPIENCVKLLSIVVKTPSSQVTRFSALLPPLVQTATRCVGSASCNSVNMVGALIEICAITEAVIAIPEPSVDLLQHLAAVLATVPRLLFAIRRWDEKPLSAVAKANLQVVWTVVSSRHPVLGSMDLQSFTQTLQSIFGIATPDGNTAAGILDISKSQEVQRIGTHIFFYLGVPPSSVHHTLPSTLPEKPSVFSS